MRCTIFLLIGTLFFSPLFLTGHIGHAEVWEREDTVCYCLGDVHDSQEKKNCVNDKQRRDVLSAAKAIEALVVIEDKEGLCEEKKVEKIFGSEYKVKEAIQGSKDLLRLYDLLIPHKSMLRGTSGLCYRAGVPVTNVEFRFLSAADRNLMLRDELDYLDTRAEKILGYDDGEALMPFYTKMIDSYRDTVYKEGKIFFEHLVKKNKPITSYDISCAPYDSKMDVSYKRLFPHSSPEKRSRFRKQKLLFSLYSTYLVDAEIVHAVAQNKDKKRIIVCAGNAHIKRIAPALKAMGYVQTDVCVGDSNAGTWESDAIDLDAFFAKHEPRYAAGEGEKTYVDYLLDMQCYCDNHPLVAFTAGITAGVASLCAALGVITSPFWCATIARNVAPHSPNARFVIEKSLLVAVMATTGFSLHTLLSSLKAP